MPVDVALNKAIRDRVRRDLAPPFADPILVIDPFVEDTSPETLARFREAGTVPTQRQSAETQARQDAQQARQSLRGFEGQRVPVGFGNLITLPGSTLEHDQAGPIPFDFTIRQVMITLSSSAAAGTIVTPTWNVIVTSERIASLAELRAGTPLITTSGLTVEGFGFARITVIGQENTIALHDVFSQPFPSGSFIHFLGNVAGARLEPTVMVEEFTATAFAPGSAFLPPIGRFSININTQPTRTRGTRTRTPRAAVFSVTSGGTIIQQRTVAWESLGRAIRTDWFNRQVGGVGDPNIRWIP